MKASVVIRTYNEERRIEECLNAVLRQRADFPFEVLLIDSESTDDTLKRASRFPVKTITVQKKNFTYGSASNVGSRAARGEYVVFLSGHSIPAGEQWLLKLIAPLENPRVAGAYGRQIPFPESNPLEKRALSEDWPAEKQTQEYNTFFSTANAAIRREIFDSEIRFNETLKAAEDNEWAMRAQKRGYFIVYEPDASVFHSHNEGIFRNYARKRRELRALASIHGPYTYSLYAEERISVLGRDAAYIRAHGYGAYWLAKSALLNVMLFFVAKTHSLKTALLR